MILQNPITIIISIFKSVMMMMVTLITTERSYGIFYVFYSSITHNFLT